MSKVIARVVALFALLLVHPGSVGAQQPDRPPSLGLGDAVVTYTPSVSSVPTVTSLSPASGSTAGGTSVAVTGTNFTGATAVKFGGPGSREMSVNLSADRGMS